MATIYRVVPTVARFCKNDFCSGVTVCTVSRHSTKFSGLEKSRGRVRHMHWSIGYNPGQGGIARVLLQRMLKFGKISEHCVESNGCSNFYYEVQPLGVNCLHLLRSAIHSVLPGRE